MDRFADLSGTPAFAKRLPMTLHRHPLVRLFAIKIGIGVVAVAAILGGLLALNPGGLRDLAFANPSLALMLALVLSASVLVFGAVAIGVAVLMSRQQ